MLSDILKSTGVYSVEDIQLFGSRAIVRHVDKDEVLINAGDLSKAIYFVITGALYQFNYKDEIDENVIDLHCDQEWFLCHNSFVSQQPSDSFIKAYAASKIVELDIASLHYLIGQSPAFLQLGKIFEGATSRVHFFDNRLNPIQKYQHILNNRPDLLQKFPLKLIASYLKITPETLSRVREKISGKKPGF